MSLSTSYRPPRSIHISEEVKFQKQRVDPAKELSQSIPSSKFNTLTTSSSSLTKPTQRSVGLYFYHRGLKVGFHRSPTLVTFTRTERIPNWHQYLKNLVLQHPAWLSYPNIKTMELHPRLPICVSFWDGTTTGIAPNANVLPDSGLISDLLRLTDCPRVSNFTQTTLTSSKGSRSISSILRMAITIHIRPIGEDSKDEENHSQLLIKNESQKNLPLTSPLSTNEKALALTSTINISSTKQSSSSETIHTKSDTGNKSEMSTHSSTTQEDTPPPSYLRSHNTSTSVSCTSYISINFKPNRPTTPITNTNTPSIIGRKRSLTLLSPQKLSTRSSRDLKRKSSGKIGESIQSLTQESENPNHITERYIEKPSG